LEQFVEGEQATRWASSDGGLVAAPGPVVWVLAEAGAQRVAHV
jgi:hypothetical protein